MPKNLTPREDVEAAILVRRLRQAKVLFAHVPNETKGLGGPHARVHRARIGVVAGVPDFLVFTPPPWLPWIRGVGIELKRQTGGQLTQSQTRFIPQLVACRWHVKTCAGADAATDFLLSLGYPMLKI